MKKVLPTLENLQQQVRDRISRIEAMTRMKAPEVILKHENEILESLLYKIQKEEYVQSAAQLQETTEYLRSIAESEELVFNSLYPKDKVCYYSI